MHRSVRALVTATARIEPRIAATPNGLTASRIVRNYSDSNGKVTPADPATKVRSIADSDPKLPEPDQGAAVAAQVKEVEQEDDLQDHWRMMERRVTTKKRVVKGSGADARPVRGQRSPSAWDGEVI
jgi:hypothetical protein